MDARGERGQMDEQQFWQAIAKADGCRHETQATLVRWFLNQQEDGSIPMNANGVPLGGNFELIAKRANQMGLRTDEGETWKRTRTQQVIFDGLARMLVTSQQRELEAQGRAFKTAVKDCKKKLWQVLKVRERHGRRWQHKPREAKHFATRRLPDGSQVLFEHKPKSDRYWSRLRFRAKAKGRYKPLPPYPWLHEKE